MEARGPFPGTGDTVSRAVTTEFVDPDARGPGAKGATGAGDEGFASAPFEAPDATGAVPAGMLNEVGLPYGTDPVLEEGDPPSGEGGIPAMVGKKNGATVDAV